MESLSKLFYHVVTINNQRCNALCSFGFMFMHSHFTRPLSGLNVKPYRVTGRWFANHPLVTPDPLVRRHRHYLFAVQLSAWKYDLTRSTTDHQ
ncbi:hypothetical protein QL285_007418 [Trifolium repens]|nr:hypothetical protein QL285_007418 [Trifolium repens]